MNDNRVIIATRHIFVLSKSNNNRHEQKNNNLNLHAMNALRNKVQLIGNVGNDPEIKILEGGKSAFKQRQTIYGI